MKSRALFLAGCMVLAMTACSIGKPPPATTTYIISLPGDAGVRADRLKDALRVASLRVAAPFAGRGLVYRFDDVRYVSDPYETFGSDPDAMLEGQIAERLNIAAPFHATLQPGSAVPTRYVLEISLMQLYGDFREGLPPAAVMTLQFTIIDTRGSAPSLIYDRSISRCVQLQQAAPEDLVRGYGVALAGILSQLVSELQVVEYPR